MAYKKNRQVWETNRDVARRARKTKFYCWCDMNIVEHGKRCYVCHRKGGDEKYNRQKKPA